MTSGLSRAEGCLNRCFIISMAARRAKSRFARTAGYSTTSPFGPVTRLRLRIAACAPRFSVSSFRSRSYLRRSDTAGSCTPEERWVPRAPVSGIRERDYRNGMKELISGGPLDKIPFLPQILSRPSWLISYLLDGGLPGLPNVVIPGKGQMPLVDINAALAESAVTWADLRWIREIWKGPIVIKGVLTADDALRSIDEGAAAISVSNHGGRQLDGVPASLRALPEVVDAAKGRIEILMDGGIRRGTDIAKAIAMGARAVLCGRASAYGVASAGEAGVERAIDILRVDLDRTLRLLGCPSVEALDRSYVNVPKSWEAS